MKRIFGFWILYIFAALSIYGKECDCGTVTNDPFYAKAVHLLDLAIEKTLFNEGLVFPESASDFYPSYDLRIGFVDHYPFEGRIKWEIDNHKTYSFFSIVKNEERDCVDLYTNNLKNRVLTASALPQNSSPHSCLAIRQWSLAPDKNSEEPPGQIPDFSSCLCISVNELIPVKISRIKEWTNHPFESLEYEHKEEKTFEFKKSYSSIPQAFQVLQNDIEHYFLKNDFFLIARLRDLASGIEVYEAGQWDEELTTRKELLKCRRKNKASHQKTRLDVENYAADAFAACAKSLDWCIKHHHNALSHMNRGLFYFLDGETLDALDQLEQALRKMKKGDDDKLKENALLLKGQTEIEAGLYADAVLTLTNLINENPKNKESYFERANAYFELGDFDLSLQDYLSSEIKSEPIANDSLEMLAFSLGLTKGIVQGGAQAGLEFIPSILNSLQGLGHGLWAFAQDPVQVSAEFVNAAQACIDFVKDHNTKETLEVLVPELGELLENWDKLKNQKRGELAGHIIGKYGVDIFAGAGLSKAMKSYRDLKRANNLLTYESMALSARNKEFIKLEAKRIAQTRKEVLKNANLTIQWDKQGKHHIEHRNFETGNSEYFHTDLQGLFNKNYGKGIKKAGDKPGTPGYREIINFEENIGYAVDPDTKEEKILTSWGTVHYAKDGVHIVPTKPRKKL